VAVIAEVWVIADPQAAGPADVRLFIPGIAAMRYSIKPGEAKMLCSNVEKNDLTVQNLSVVSIEIGVGRDLQFGQGLRIPPNSTLAQGQIIPGSGAILVVEKFFKAALPAPGNQGRLAELLDDDRQIWLDNGAQWYSITGRVFNVMAFGAKGDGIADDTLAIQAAINACSAAGGGITYLPFGTYFITSALSLPATCWLCGQGQRGANRVVGNGTNILVKSDIEAIKSIFAINNSTAANQVISDLAVIQQGVAGPTGAGIDQVGGSFVLIRNVSIVGFKYGIVFDQTEVSEIDLCDFEVCSTAGIWLANGPDHTPGAGTQLTNRISITRCQINNTGIGVLDDGGTSHTIRDCNFNGCTTQIRAAGAGPLTIGPGNELESASVRSMKFTSNTLAGTGVGQCHGVTIFGNQISAGGGGALDALNFDNGDPVSIFGNVFATTVTGIVGLSNLGLFTHFGNTISGGGALTDGGSPTTNHIDLDQSTRVAPQIATFNANGQTVALASTSYGGITGLANLNAAENIRQQVMSQPGVCKRLFVVTNGAQPAGGSFVITVRKNGANTALTVTIPAGAAAGTFSDLVHSFTFAAGDLLGFQLQNNDPANPSAVVNSAAVMLSW
jgi:pectate lyase-like protein